MTRLGVVCFEGVTDLDVFLHWDLLNRPRTLLGLSDSQWQVVLLGSAPTHRTQAGLAIPMHADIKMARELDAVVHASGPATRSLVRDAGYLETLALDATTQYLGGQCSGALILAASGMLEGLTATTYPSARDELESFGVSFKPQALVAHDRVATAAGCLAGAAMDDWLLSKFLESAEVKRCLASVSPWGGGLEALTGTS